MEKDFFDRENKSQHEKNSDKFKSGLEIVWEMKLGC